MKLTTRDLSVFLIGAVATVLSMMAYHHFVDDRNPFNSLSSNNNVMVDTAKTKPPRTGIGNGKGGSKQVSFETLKTSLGNYLNDPNAMLVQYYDSTKKDSLVRTLEGFVFTADQLKDLITKNKSGIKPDQVLFYLGENGQFSYGGNTYGKMTLTAIGMKNGVLVYKKDSTNVADPSDESIYDQADPSPPFGAFQAPQVVKKAVPKN